MTTTGRDGRVRRISYATCAWSVLFGIPHFYWSLVGDLGFPGGSADYDMVMSSGWRVVYFWVVNTCCVLGVLVPLALLESPDSHVRRWIPQTLAWCAAVLLTLRGVAGFVFDRSLAGYGWDSAFLAGGILFLLVAASARRAALSVQAR